MALTLLALPGLINRFRPATFGDLLSTPLETFLVSETTLPASNLVYDMIAQVCGHEPNLVRRNATISGEGEST